MDDPLHTDVGLLARIAQRDPQALAALYERHAKQVFSLATAMLEDHAQAADLTQDVFLLVWRYAGTFYPTGSPRAWLLRLTRNRAIDELRRKRRRIQDDVRFSADQLQVFPAPLAQTDPAERQAIRAAVEGLPASQREALVLAFFHGLSHREISVRLQTPLGTIKARIRRALLTLFEQFRDKG